MISVALMSLAITLLMIVAFWMIFQKAEKPGWAVIVPVYNVIVFLQMIGKPWWWLVLSIIPLINLIFLIWMANLQSKVFGKGIWFTIGLLFLPFIFVLILAFGDARYNRPAKAI